MSRILGEVEPLKYIKMVTLLYPSLKIVLSVQELNLLSLLLSRYSFRTSPAIFNTFADALAWILISCGSIYQPVHYLDDFFMCAPDMSRHDHLQCFLLVILMHTPSFDGLMVIQTLRVWKLKISLLHWVYHKSFPNQQTLNQTRTRHV